MCGNTPWYFAWWKYRPYQIENDIRLIGIAFFYLSLELNRPPGSCGGSVIYYSTYVFGRLGEASQHSITIHNIYCCLNLFHLPTNLIFWIQYYIPWNVLHFSWFYSCMKRKTKYNLKWLGILSIQFLLWKCIRWDELRSCLLLANGKEFRYVG